MDISGELFQGKFAEGMAWAQKKRDARIAEIGLQAY